MVTNGNNQHPKWLEWLIVLGLLVAVILPRALDLDQYATTDETLWLQRSANFYYALGQREFAQTYQDKHPGVSIMWAGATSFLVNYPEYSGMRQGYFLPLDFHDFLDREGKEPLELLVAGRTFLVIGTAVLFIAAFLITEKLIGKLPATLGFLFIAFDPFLIGLNTILHPDNLLPSFMLLSSVSYIAYLYKGRKTVYLIISAVAAAGSWLTKYAGLFLIPYIGLLTIIETIERKIAFGELIKRATRSLLLWFLLAIIVFMALWPSAWVNPEQTFFSIIDTFNSGFISQIELSTLLNGQIVPLGDHNYSFYPVHYLWRTTPMAAIGIGLAIIRIFSSRNYPDNIHHRKFIFMFLLFSFFFTLAMSMGNLKANRYIGSIFPVLDLVAAVGWITIIDTTHQWLKNRFNLTRAQIISALFICIVVAAQILAVWQVRPYYWSYYNPLLGGPNLAPGNIDIGYGEGLDQAGRYLETKPNANELTVLSWYGVGPFSYFYSGPFNFTAIIPDWTKTNARRLAEADYIVIYVNQSQRQLTRPLLDVLTSVEPEHIIVINNIEYAWIYDVRDIPQEDFEYLTSFE